MDKEAYEYNVDPRTTCIQKPHDIWYYRVGMYGRIHDDVKFNRHVHLALVPLEAKDRLHATNVWQIHRFMCICHSIV